MIKKSTYFKALICIFLFSQSGALSAQDNDESEKAKSNLASLSKLKVSGYIQGQFQYGEKDALLNVGGGNENPDKAFNRIGVRRGRLKFVYEEGIASGVFQIDLTEKGIAFKDAYLNIKDPWIKTNALRAGIFDRPFGYEISYSSSRRESPERSKIFQALFPEERDLGAMLILQPDEYSLFNFIKLQAGMFAGNGIKPETDNRKDFIGQLILSQYITMNLNINLGVSYYNGGVYQGTDSIYTMEGGSFVLDAENNKGKFAKREYFGFDTQFQLMTTLGSSQLRGEYLFGTQPGTAGSTKSPNDKARPKNHTYIRNFKGGYVMFVQNIGFSPFSAVIKYDWYTPNTKTENGNIGAGGTGRADLKQTGLGFGALWQANENIRLQAYYEINKLEKSALLPELEDLKLNIFTLRLQYKF